MTDAVAALSTPSAAPRAAAATTAERDPRLWAKAKEFEAVFLSEMFKQAKIGAVDGPFSGGYGAETYRSFLVDAYADAASAQRSFGLAEALYTQMRALASDGDAQPAADAAPPVDVQN